MSDPVAGKSKFKVALVFPYGRCLATEDIPPPEAGKRSEAAGQFGRVGAEFRTVRKGLCPGQVEQEGLQVIVGGMGGCNSGCALFLGGLFQKSVAKGAGGRFKSHAGRGCGFATLPFPRKKESSFAGRIRLQRLRRRRIPRPADHGYNSRRDGKSRRRGKGTGVNEAGTWNPSPRKRRRGSFRLQGTYRIPLKGLKRRQSLLFFPVGRGTPNSFQSSIR